MAAADEMLVRDALATPLGLAFENGPLVLGEWGKADCWALLHERCRLLLEVESQQTHPSTNVLKVWPFLEEQKDLSVLLVHAFFVDSRSLRSSRAKLASWLGARLESMFPGRFWYRRVVLDRGAEKWQGFEELRTCIGNIRRQG